MVSNCSENQIQNCHHALKDLTCFPDYLSTLPSFKTPPPKKRSYHNLKKKKNHLLHTGTGTQAPSQFLEYAKFFFNLGALNLLFLCLEHASPGFCMTGSYSTSASLLKKTFLDNFTKSVSLYHLSQHFNDSHQNTKDNLQ